MEIGYSHGTNPTFAGIVILTVATICQSSECPYGSTAPAAEAGKTLVLECGITCHSLIYGWYHLNSSGGGRTKVTGESGRKLVVSENVTSAAEVGGQLYQCGCSGTDECEMFKIGVKPKVQLLTSVPVARSGSSVSVTCMAESYPPADSVENYLMKHPKDKDIDRVLLPTMNGVVHHITAASKTADSGEYECTVTVTMAEYSNATLQSDNVFVNLIVYDPPKTSNVRNFTISEVGQAAVLECSVSNTEGNGLKVWVNWTTSANRTLREEHVTFRKGNIFYLILNNASAGDYMCRVFSTHSPHEPEDVRIASVTMEGLTPTTQGFVKVKEDESSTTAVIILAVLLSIALLTVVVLVSWFICNCLRRRRLRWYLNPPARPSLVETNPSRVDSAMCSPDMPTLKPQSPLMPAAAAEVRGQLGGVAEPKLDPPSSDRYQPLPTLSGSSEQNQHMQGELHIYSTIESQELRDGQEGSSVNHSEAEIIIQPQSQRSPVQFDQSGHPSAQSFEGQPSVIEPPSAQNEEDKQDVVNEMGTPSAEAFERQPSMDEPPSAQPQDMKQEESASRTPDKENRVRLQHQTSEPASQPQQDSGKMVEVRQPSVLSSRAIFKRSKSLCVGSPSPSSGISESGSWSQRLRDLSFTQHKQLKAEKEKLLHEEEPAERDPHFTVRSDEEEEHSD